MKIEKLTFQIYLTEKRLNLWTSQIFFVHWHFYASRYRKTMRSKKHVIIQMQKLRKQSKFCGIKWNNKTANN